MPEKSTPRVLYVTVPDEAVLDLLRQFFEPLGYRVEFAPGIKVERAPSKAVKVAAAALLLMALENLGQGFHSVSA